MIALAISGCVNSITMDEFRFLADPFVSQPTYVIFAWGMTEKLSASTR